MITPPADELTGDEARMYWLGVIHDELTAALAAAHSIQELSPRRFEFVLNKIVNLCNTAVISNGNTINRMEH